MNISGNRVGAILAAVDRLARAALGKEERAQAVERVPTHAQIGVHGCVRHIDKGVGRMRAGEGGD